MEKRSYNSLQERNFSKDCHPERSEGSVCYQRFAAQKTELTSLRSSEPALSEAEGMTAFLSELYGRLWKYLCRFAAYLRASGDPPREVRLTAKQEIKPAPPGIAAAAEFDLGELGCGDLAMALMHSIKPLRPGQVLKVLALDLGASADIPAWCNMTGHKFLGASRSGESVFYYIEKGESEDVEAAG